MRATFSPPRDIVWIDDDGLRHIDYSKIDSIRKAPPPVESGDSV
jgi:hypothetical protein